MANIHSVHSVGGPGGIDPGRPEKTQKSSDNKGPSFSDVLNKTAGASRGAASGGTPPAGGVSPVPPAYIGPVESAGSDRETVHRTSEEVLGLLESLREELKNPAASMKDIAPLMLGLEARRDQLINEIDGLPAGDAGRMLLEEMAGVLTSESAKFHRGEYI